MRLPALFLLCFTLLSASVQVIPKPLQSTQNGSTFTLDSHTRFYTDTPLAKTAVVYLQDHLQRVSGYRLKQTDTPVSGTLYFHYAPKSVTKAEGYRLHIDKKGILIQARDRSGFFYGVITLMQLMSKEIWGEDNIQKKKWRIEGTETIDAPRYHWRGMMLDVSRNFFSVAYIKKFLDRMAQYKLNRFHWHLTDDEGWRIEIKRYPLLTKIGAVRGPGTKLPFSTFPAMRGPKDRVQRGFYTQSQIRDIVAYARSRCIEVLPEIDMPGHAKAALVSYPKLLTDPNDTSRYRSVQRVANNTLNPGLENTYRFLDGVIGEVAALFPFGYIHLGGDEVPKGAWSHSPAVKKLMQKRHLKNRRDVQNYFFSRVDAMLAKHGKKMVAWQEVIEGRPSLRKTDMVMAWKSPRAGYKAIKQHRNTIMAPVQYLYFDQQYRRSKRELGHTWSDPVSTQKTYSFNPGTSTYLAGVHACLWSETLLNEKTADYLTWPRTLALAEVAWSSPKQKKWSDFKRRMKVHALPRLKIQGIQYRPVK